MLLTQEIAALFPSLGEWDKPFSWSIFEVGTKRYGTLLAIGMRENVDPRGPSLEVRAFDLTERRHDAVVMFGGGSWTGYKRVKITGGDVLVRRADLRGSGIGTLMLNVAIDWAQRTFPNENVESVTLINREDGDRLTRFYGRFGFRWNRPAGGWKGSFPSIPMTVRDLKQYPESSLENIRRVDLPKSMTAIFDRLLEADDDRQTVSTLRTLLADKRECWRTIGYRVNMFALVVVALVAFAAGRATVLL